VRDRVHSEVGTRTVRGNALGFNLEPDEAFVRET